MVTDAPAPDGGEEAAGSGWREVRIRIASDGAELSDPLAKWIEGPGADDYRPCGDGRLTACLFEMDGLTAREFSEIFLDPTDEGRCGHDGEEAPPDPPPGARVPPLYGVDETTFTAYVTEDFFRRVFSEEGGYRRVAEAIRRLTLGLPLGADAVGPPLGESAASPVAAVASPPKVVLGVIDDGIAFANARFRHGDGVTTRVARFWLQDAPRPPGAPVPYGSELTKTEIDQLMADHRQAGQIDEDAIYRAVGLADFSRPGHKSAARRASHGTHVLDQLAGAPLDQAPDDAPIVCVQLPTSVTADSSGAGLAPYVLDAFRYILSYADSVSPPAGPLPPAIVNFSYATQAGPHDGTSPLEVKIDEIVEARASQSGQSRVVLPAGNAHLSRCHARVEFEGPTDVVPLDWLAPPDDRTPSFLEIWLPWEGASPPADNRMTITVATPGGDQSPPLGEAEGQSLQYVQNGQVVCDVSYYFAPFPTQRGMFRLSLQPTARLMPTTPALAARRAPSGIWRLRLRNALLAPTDPVELWIERDDTVFGFPARGRQSTFRAACYRRFDAAGRPVEEDGGEPPCPVRRAGLLNGIASGQTPIVAGGFDRQGWRAAPYSAGGPVTPPRDCVPPLDRRRPDAMFVSDDSRVARGVLGAGTRSGSVVALTGTSVAAPGLGRWLAERTASNPTETLADARTALQDAAELSESSPPPKPPLPAKRGGWGRIAQPPLYLPRGGPR